MTHHRFCLAAAALALLACAGVARAEKVQIDPSYNKVVVCDPADATHCVVPTAGGSLPVSVSGGGDASAANQTSVQANAGSDATKAVSIQGITSGKAVPVSGTLAATQSGTWTVQPGNTANTTAWKVDGSAVTQPVSGTVTANAGTGTFATNEAQINGVAPSMGNGVSGTGVQRVTIASDSTGQVTLASGATAAVTQATASNLNAQVVGNIAGGSADSGNPVKVGGVYNSTQPTLTTGQRGDVQLNVKGALTVAIANAQVAADGTANSNFSGPQGSGSAGVLSGLVVAPSNFNGTTWDRQYGITGLTTAGTGVSAAGMVGQYNSTLPTLTTGQYGVAQLNAKGAVNVAIASAGGAADGVSNAQVTTPYGPGGQLSGGLVVANTLYNGSTWDRGQSAQNGTNSAGTGIAAAGLLAQRDDTSPVAITENSFGNLRMDGLNHALIVRPYDSGTNAWSYVAVTGGITNQTAVTIKTAAGAGLKNYITDCQIQNNSAVASEYAIRNTAGSNIIAGAIGANQHIELHYTTPVAGAANTATEVIMGTTATVTYVSCQGFVAP